MSSALVRAVRSSHSHSHRSRPDKGCPRKIHPTIRHISQSVSQSKINHRSIAFGPVARSTNMKSQRASIDRSILQSLRVAPLDKGGYAPFLHALAITYALAVTAIGGCAYISPPCSGHILGKAIDAVFKAAAAPATPCGGRSGCRSDR